MTESDFAAVTAAQPSQPTTPTTPATNAVLSPQGLRVDGKDIDCEKYNIGGSNYFKLRDLAYALNGTGSQFGVGYDEATATVTITTGEAYTPTGTEMATGVDNSRLLFALILMIAGLVLVVVGGFCAASFCVGVLTNCDMDTAAERIRKFVKNLWTKYKDKKANNDTTFEENLRYASENEIYKLVDEQRYQQRCALAESVIDQPLVFAKAGDEHNLSCIANSVYYADDNEKRLIESKLINITEKCLHRYRFYTRTLAIWGKRPDLHMPVLFIYYAKTSAQKEILDEELEENRNKIVTMNTAVVDDTEEVDLFE